MVGNSFNRNPINLGGATLSKACFSALLGVLSRRTTMIVASEMRDMISASAIGNRGEQSTSTQSNAAFAAASRTVIREEFRISTGSTSSTPAGNTQTLTPAIRRL